MLRSVTYQRGKAALIWLMVAIWPAVIFFLSAQPTWTGSQQWMLLDLVRDLAHVIVFFVLTAVIWLGLAHADKLSARLALLARHRSRISFVFSLFYAVFDEIHQSFVPGRASSVKDVLLDVVGSLLAVAVLVAWSRRAELMDMFQQAAGRMASYLNTAAQLRETQA